MTMRFAGFVFDEGRRQVLLGSEALHLEPKVIRTVRGFGYAFCGTALEDGRPTDDTCRWIAVHAGREIPLPAGLRLIGRAEKCPVRCVSSRVSRQHARVRVTASTAFIEDLRSRNGTWLRGHRIERASEIQPGDVVSVGPEEIQFVALDGQASTTRD